MSQWLPIADMDHDVQTGQLHATELVERSLRIIRENADYKAVISLTDKRARQRASAIDEQVKKGKPVGRLAGVPFIAKDNFLAYGADTTAASTMLKGFDAPYQASAIERLEAEGAICVAKANLDAFAHGSSTENSDYFTTHNPHDKSRVPGGSSGGSATAVVLQMAPFALGTDTGGSIRQPASFTGSFGYKPTYGLISRSGVVAMASSTDTIGALANSVDDLGLVIDVMAGKDVLDSTTIERDSQGYTHLTSQLKGKRIGLIKEYMGEGVEPGVLHVVNHAVEQLKKAGATIEEISLPSLPLVLAVYYIIVPAEISSNLSRYDGQRFGYAYKTAKTLSDSYEKSRGHGFGYEAKRRIMIGTYVLSSGYYDAYYKKAQTVRTMLIEEFTAAFKQVDYLAGPVAPTTAFQIGANTSNPLNMYLTDIMTVAANLTGIPAISIPAGVSNKLPVGLQLMAAPKQDRALLIAAKSAEQVLV